jgi:hypothetical protein
MNVDELNRLAEWYNEHFPRLSSLYNALISPIQHNASQPNKQTVEDQMEQLLSYLSEMKFDDLSIQQLNMLSKIGVDRFIGAAGVSCVNSVIRTSNYDPATAAQKLNEAIQSIASAHSGFTSYINAVSSLKALDQKNDDEDKFITIRVGFQNDASIDNITDWKDSGKDWYDIIRGLSLACGEAPEDTKVIGAASGSIILILAGTYSLTKLLALISKSVSSVAKDVIEVRSSVEDLRQKKLLTEAMQKEFTQIENGKKSGALSEILKTIESKIPRMDGEVRNALKGSIQKLLSFNEKGGNVDFVAPDTQEDGSSGEPNAGGESSGDLKVALAEAQAAIREYQGERENLKLLMHQTKGGNE